MRERQTDRQRQNERERQTDRQNVCERERERERELNPDFQVQSLQKGLIKLDS